MTPDNDNPTDEHGEIITCKCGERFTSQDAFERHKRAAKRRRFNDLAEQFIADNLGLPFTDYFRNLRGSMGGMAAYETAREEDLPTEPTTENVRKAALSWAQGALLEPNATALLDRIPERIFVVLDLDDAEGAEMFDNHGERIDGVPVLVEEWTGDMGDRCEECGETDRPVFRLESDTYGIPVCRECLEGHGWVIDVVQSNAALDYWKRNLDQATGEPGAA